MFWFFSASPSVVAHLFAIQHFVCHRNPFSCFPRPHFLSLGLPPAFSCSPRSLTPPPSSQPMFAPRRPDAAVAAKELKTNVLLFAAFCGAVRAAPFVLHALANRK